VCVALWVLFTGKYSQDNSKEEKGDKEEENKKRREHSMQETTDRKVK